MILSETFGSAKWEELVRGYVLNEERYVCLLCGEVFEKGLIYSSGDRLFEAFRAVEEHIEKGHGEGVLDFLLGLNKKLTGLSEVQVRVLQGLGQGLGDRELGNKLGISASTVRNHRFRLKEKARQARVFLAVMALVDRVNKVDNFVPPHRSATVLDQRYEITKQEQEKIQKNYFKDGRLTRFPAKEKKKIVVLRYLIERFQFGQVYSENDVNESLLEIFDDFATLRRYFIQYGFFERERDGSAYRRVA